MYVLSVACVRRLGRSWMWPVVNNVTRWVTIRTPLCGWWPPAMANFGCPISFVLPIGDRGMRCCDIDKCKVRAMASRRQRGLSD